MENENSKTKSVLNNQLVFPSWLLKAFIIPFLILFIPLATVISITMILGEKDGFNELGGVIYLVAVSWAHPIHMFMGWGIGDAGLIYLLRAVLVLSLIAGISCFVLTCAVRLFSKLSKS